MYIGIRPKLNTWKKDFNGENIYEDMILEDDGNVWEVKFGEYQANNNQNYMNEFAYGFYLKSISHPGVIEHATGIHWMTIKK
jgi:hypothetical protein